MNLTVTYKNPDTDGIACVIGAGILFSYIPTFQGELSEETKFVLSQTRIVPPQRVDNYDNADKIILVDTHHRAQLGDNFPAEKVIRIIDHHSGGDDSWFENAEIDNREIGAAASIIGEIFLNRGRIQLRLAQLLQYAIASNTLYFSAPSTTEFDKRIFNRLKKVFPATNIDEMLRNRTNGSVTSDVKFFDFKNGKIAISQIEQYMTQLDRNKIIEELGKLDDDNGLIFSVFNCVDIGNKRSIVYFSKGISDGEIKKIFGFDVHDGVCEVERILLRKTDFIPSLLKYTTNL